MFNRIQDNTPHTTATGSRAYGASPSGLRGRAGRALLLAGVVLAPLASMVPAAQAQEQQVPPIAAVVPAPLGINSASAAEIAERLTGIGPSKAEAIIRYREEFGPFESIEELAEVNGIGPATLQRLRGQISLD